MGSSTVDQVLKYTKYPKYRPSTSTGQQARVQGGAQGAWAPPP